MTNINNQEFKPKFYMYCRVGTKEQSNLNDYGLAGKYYILIQKFENHLKKYEQLPTKKVSSKYKDILSFINEYYAKEYYPWRSLPKGRELEEINKIFSSDVKGIINYLKITDMLHDNFYTLAEDELKKYYSKEQVSKSEDKIIEELLEFNFDRKFKRKVFSKETLELHRLFEEAQPLEKELYDTYIQLREKETFKNNEIEEEIEK